MRGHIRRRGTSWQVLVKVTDPVTGKQRQLSGTRPTKAAAETLLVKMLADAGRSSAVGTSATVADLLDAWQEVNADRWSPSTARQTRALVDRYLRPRIGKLQLRKLRTSDLDLMYADLRRRGGLDEQPLAVGTVRRIHTAVRSALAQAVRWEWIVDNPAARATLPRGDAHRITPPDPSAVVTILEAALDDDPDFGTWLHLAATTGARRGELCALRWADVDLERDTIRIHRSIALGDQLVEKDTKTGSVRRITVDAGTVEILTAHRRRARERALAVGARLDDHAYVFSLDPTGAAPWRPDLATHRFVRLRDRLGLDGIRLHDLRHFHATHLLAAGLDVASVGGRLGHANGGRTTQAIYAHWLQSSDTAAANVIAGVLAGTNTPRRDRTSGNR
jgi:integrase